MRFLLPFFLLYFVSTGSAQVNIVNRSLTDSSLKYLYIGVDNAIEVNWGHYDPSKTVVSIYGGGGILTKISDKKFNIRVTTVTDECRICISNKQGKLIFDQVYKVRVIHEPAVSVDGLRDTTVSRERLLVNPVLMVTAPECYFRFDASIVSFVMTAVDERDSVVAVQTTGAMLSQEQINLIRMTRENLLTFENIRVLCSDGRTRQVPSIIIYIKK